VQFQNNAGLTSASVTDSIVLEDCANLASVPHLVAGRDAFGGTVLSWSMRPQVADVVWGDLDLLRASGGDYSAATSGCLENDRFETWANVPFGPAPARGHWFLVRPADCGGGSYDDGGSGQLQSRDPGIAASGAACP
jgi:hypothetical protein